MRLYLDDDIVAAPLVRLLRQAGHDVQIPIDVSLAGEEDPVHLRHAIQESRVTLTKNYCDFQLLHFLILEATGHHPGILVVREDNDPKRDLTPRRIIRAIINLQASGLPIQDSYHILNHWR